VRLGGGAERQLGNATFVVVMQADPSPRTFWIFTVQPARGDEGVDLGIDVLDACI
jgi:hypothetical protein